MFENKVIVFGSANSISKNLFADVVNSDKFIYYDSYCVYESKLKSALLSHRLHKLLPNSIRRLIYIYIFNYVFLKDKKDYIYVFNNMYELFGYDINSFIDFIDFLRFFNNRSKMCIYFMDSFEVLNCTQIQDYINRFDKVYTYNKYDSEQYNIEYYGPISEKDVLQTSENEQNDLIYAGSVKGKRFSNRLKIVLEVFDRITRDGKKCTFYLSGVSNEEIDDIRKRYSIEDNIIAKGKSILYINKYISSINYLSLLKSSECVLEIVSKESKASCTCRLAQAMAYKKKLITNCHREKEESYYYPENIHIINNAEDIDIDFFDIPFRDFEYDFSATKMIEQMEKELNICR